MVSCRSSNTTPGICSRFRLRLLAVECGESNLDADRRRSGGVFGLVRFSRRPVDWRAVAGGVAPVPSINAIDSTLFCDPLESLRNAYAASGSSRIRFTADLASQSRAFCRNSAVVQLSRQTSAWIPGCDFRFIYSERISNRGSVCCAD